MSLRETIRDAAREFKRLPKWQQTALRYAMRGNECPSCDGFGCVRQYEPSTVASNPWITVACSCECHREAVYCSKRKP